MIVDRLLLGVVGRSLAASAGVLLTLGLLLDFLDSARRVLAGRAGAGEVLLYYLCKAPPLLYLILPLALAVAVAAGLASLGRAREIRALAAAGWGPGRLALPLGALAALVALANFALGEWAVPAALDRQERLMAGDLGRVDSSWRFFRNHMWAAGEEGRLLRSSARSPDGRRLTGVIALTPDARGGLAERLNAGEVVFREGRWLARGAERLRFEEGRLVSRSLHRELELGWREGPERFRDLSGRPQQLSLAALAETVAALEARGLGAAEHRLEAHARFAWPLSGLLLAVLLLPWALSPARSHSLARAILAASAAGAAVLFLFTVGRSAVASGALVPPLGAWLPVLLLALLGLGAWSRVRRPGRPGRRA